MAEFGALQLDDVQAEENRLNSKGQGSFLDQFVPVQDMKAGESLTIRLCPPAKGGKLFQYNRIHSINGRKVNCPRPLVSGRWDKSVPCPICSCYESYWKQIEQLEKDGKKEEAEELKREAREIKANERYYYNAIVRKMTVDGETKTNVGPRILSVGKVLHQMIIRAIVSEDPQERLGDVTNVKNGFDFIIRKDIRSGFPNYDRSTFAREPSPLGEPEFIDEVAQNLIDLTKFRSLKDLEEIKKELAIYRKLIPDESTDFDLNKFDSDYTSEHQVEVPNVSTETSHEVSSETSTSQSAPEEDLGIDSEEYLADLAEFRDEG